LAVSIKKDTLIHKKTARNMALSEVSVFIINLRFTHASATGTVTF